MKHDNLTLAWLDEATADEIAELPPAMIDALRAQLAEDHGVLQRRHGKLEQGITVRYGERAHAAFAPKGGVGTIHLDDGDYDVAIEASKTVKWDQDKLPTILDSLPEDIARHICKVTVGIDERKFLAALPDIQKQLLPARTVKPGGWRFSFKRKEAEAA